MAWASLSSEVCRYAEGLGARPGDPAPIVPVEADPNPSEVDWDILDRHAAAEEFSH